MCSREVLLHDEGVDRGHDHVVTAVHDECWLLDRLQIRFSVHPRDVRRRRIWHDQRLTVRPIHPAGRREINPNQRSDRRAQAPFLATTTAGDMTGSGLLTT